MLLTAKCAVYIFSLLIITIINASTLSLDLIMLHVNFIKWCEFSQNGFIHLFAFLSIFV